jgi:pimeloyl-ACP methyl ester carboxylesterase
MARSCRSPAPRRRVGHGHSPEWIGRREWLTGSARRDRPLAAGRESSEFSPPIVATNHEDRVGLSEAQLQTATIGEGPAARRIAFHRRLARPNGGTRPGLVWLPGFKSDMLSTKASALDVHCAAEGRALLRFDYSGHGQSGGRFEEATISHWLEESLALIRMTTQGPQVIVGSSMGGYLALLAARALWRGGEAQRLAGLVLIAPAVDFTEALIWRNASEEARRAIIEQGAWLRPSAYSSEPYPITRALIEDGRRHLLLGGAIRAHCRVAILQGMQDEDVPFSHAMTLIEHMAGDSVTLTLVKDGDHRLSRDEDIALMLSTIEGFD